MTNKKKKEPKKHHYLPQFYLENFKIDNDNKIPQINVIIKNKRPFDTFVSAIKDTGCETDYHTLEINDTEKDRSTVESNLSKVETIHASLVKKIITKKKIDSDDKEELIKFLLLMRMRVPTNKKHIEGLLKSCVKTTYNILDKCGKLPPKPKILQDIIDKGINPIKISISNWKLVQEMFRHAQNEDLIKVHKKLNMTLCEICDDEFFITSDVPVSIYYPKHDGTYGTPILSAKTELFLPISNKFGILFTNHQNAPEHIILSKKQTNEFNRRTIIMAKTFLYLPKITDSIIKLIKRYWNQNAGQTLDVIDQGGKGAFMIGRILPVTD